MGEKLGLKGCYEAVKSKNYTVFGYQYGVQCYSSPNAEDRYDKYGPGTGCSPMGTGADFLNHVYKIGTIAFYVLMYATYNFFESWIVDNPRVYCSF